MNIPATRKQPSVSPPGQFPGYTQVRAQQHFALRGTTPPVNIRSQTPEAAFEGQQLQYQRVARPTFSSSPTGYTQLGTSPHIQQVAHIAQASQQQLRASQPTLQVISADNPTVLLHPGSGHQPPSQQTSQPGSSPRPQKVQLTSQHQVAQVYPPPVLAGQTSTYPGPHSSQQTQQHQLAQQQQQQGSYPSQQAPRYQQSGPQYFSSQRPPTPQQQTHTGPGLQATDGQVNLGLPHSQQAQQILVSQAYTQGGVPHDINKAALGITAPQRGQTPPQSALQTTIMYNQQPPAPRHPGHQTYGRGNMAAPPRQPRPQLANPNVCGQVYIPQPRAMPPVQLVPQPNTAPQLSFQYQAAQMPAAYASSLSAQTQYTGGPYYAMTANNQGGQNQWPQQPPRMIQQTNTQQNQSYQRREKKVLKIVDPTTGQAINLDEVKTGVTPPQSGTASSRDTPSGTPPTQTENDNIKAQFATQVAATLGDKPAVMQQQQQQPPQQPAGPAAGQVPPHVVGVQPSHPPVQMPQMMPPQQQAQPQVQPQAQQPIPQQQQPIPQQQQPIPQQQQPIPPQQQQLLQQQQQIQQQLAAPQQQVVAQQLPQQHSAVPLISGVQRPPAPAPGQAAMPQSAPALAPVQQQPAQMARTLYQPPPPPPPQQQQQPQQPPQQLQQQQTQQPQQQPAIHQQQVGKQVHRQQPAQQVMQSQQQTSVQVHSVPSEEPAAQQVGKTDVQVEESVSPQSTADLKETITQEPAVSDVQSEISDVVQPTTEADLAIASDVKQSITSQPSNGSLDKETASSVPVSKPSVDSCVHDVVDASAEDTDVMKPDPEAKSSKPVPPATTAPAVSEDRNKKTGKMRSKESGVKREKVEKTDVDTSKESTSTVKESDATNVESSESKHQVVDAAAAAVTSSVKETAVEAENSSEPSKETSPDVAKPSAGDATTTAVPPQEETSTEAKSSEDEQRRVAERNEKNSKEHSKTEEPVVETSNSSSSVSPENIENHVDGSNSTIEKPEPVIKKCKFELKYKYREDQWSPLNPEGKKHYDRHFLLQLQYSDESLAKPDGLPQLPDVVLDAPVMNRNACHTSNYKGTLDFTPSYVMSNASSKPPVHQRRSQQKVRAGGGSGPPPKVINLPLQQEVKLHQTKNAWKPGIKKKEMTASEELDDLQEMLKKVRGILNKLTPQKFQVLLQQVLDLGIDTEAKLAGTIDITFEKAISEPNFSVAYANLCKCMSDLKVPTANNPNEFVVFRKLLLNRCQKEFQKDKTDLLDIEKIQKAIDEAETPERKKELQEEKELAELKARQRSLGNIRFIGELFKLKMLTENIMHECLCKLLYARDEDSLEALCRLLSTIGKDIDHEKAKDRVDQYFRQLKMVVDAKKTSARVRFMILDIIELRRNRWIPRRDENNPKTIEQIHKEAHEEEQRKKLMLSNANIDPKRKPGRGSGSRHNQQGDDGWTPVKASRLQTTLDPSKMKITKQSLDENIQLGPGGRPGSLGNWGRGSSGGSKVSTKESERPSTPGNRYSALSGSGATSGSENYEIGRTGYSRSALPTGGRDARGGRLSQGRDRGKSGAKVSQEKERESALAAARNIVGPRSASGSRTPVQSRNQSRESSRNRDKSADMRPPSVTAKELPVAEIEKKTKSLMDEYLSINDLKEALLCIDELESPQNLHMCVYFILTHVLERSAKARQMASHLLREAIKDKVITRDHYTMGLKELLEFADDMAIDIPQIWKYLGELIGPMIEDGLWPLPNLQTCCRPLLPIKKSGVLVAHALQDASKRLGQMKVRELWRQNGMKWSNLLSPDENVQEFLKQNNLEYTVTEDVPKSPDATTLPMERVRRELERLIESPCDNERVFDWINANITDERTKESDFIRALMTAVCSSSLIREDSSCKVDTDRLKKRFILLQRFLDHDAKLELQALYALQALIHKLEHPTGVLRTFFETLYDEDIISEDAFFQWESSEDPTEQAGKGVAVTSVVQFFTWLREAEDEEPGTK